MDATVEDARTAIQQTLGQVKAYLAQEAPPPLSEADTKAYFVEPVIRALGWEGLGVVTREYYVRNSQEFIDYMLRGGPDGPLMAIETKKLQVDLADKHAAQLVQYCAVEGIEWAALTNGRELHFFNTFLKRDLAAKRVMVLDLLAFNSDEEFGEIFAQLWQLSRTQMTAPSGVRTWMHQRRMDTALRQVLANPGSAVMGHLQAALADADVNATPQDLVQWFRSVLGDPKVVPLPRRKGSGANGDNDDKGEGAGTAKRAKRLVTFTDGTDAGGLLPLIAAGLLNPGSRLVIRRRGNVELEATVDDLGRIVHDGRPHRSPSDRAFSLALGRQSLNGWRSWEVKVEGAWLVLDDLRQRLAATGEPVPSVETSDLG